MVEKFPGLLGKSWSIVAGQKEAILGAKWSASGNWACRLAQGIGDVCVESLGVSVLLKGP